MPLTKRLRAAFELLRAYGTVADIGCDHGKLAAALARDPAVKKVVAADISAPSLEKARQLAERLRVTEKLDCRLGNGLGVLTPGECEAAAVLGLGGEVMVKMLGEAEETAGRLSCLVLQPMSGVEEIRAFLYENGWSVKTDVLIEENGRIFQLFSVRYAGVRDPWPEGFPKGCFSLGYRCFEKRDPLLPALAGRYLAVREKKMAEAAGSDGLLRLEKEREDLRNIVFACKNHI